MVTSGMRGVLTEVLGLAVSAVVKVRPHTKQRVAVSLSRVPQVGQILPLVGEPADVCVGVSGLISSNDRTVNRSREDYTILSNGGFLISVKGVICYGTYG
jgi:hypothetical protein